MKVKEHILKNHGVKEEIKRKLEDNLEANINENTTYQN